MTGRPTVTLYGHWICPFSVRVSFALAQRAVPFGLVEVPPTAVRPLGFVVPEPFLEHSPRGEIPLLRIGRHYLADSLPILEWMEAELPQPALLPSDGPGRALVRSRVARLDRDVNRSMIGVYYGVDDRAIALASSRLGAALALAGRWVEETGWLAGHRPTLAEAVMVPLYVRFEALRRLGFDAAVPPEIDDHRRRCAGLRGWEAVAWAPWRTEELVRRFSSYRRRVRADAPAVG